MERATAVRLAEQFIDEKIRPEYPQEIVVCSVDDYPTIWAVGFQTRAFVEGGDFRDSLIGYGPIVVPKSGGALWIASSARPVADQIND